ncbi:unnamed protein product [Macrosiphum euphorbiae]|uniref:Uncharacterized protein n=1 Tax=Macrosiphum euphorbiae TaxID=13131 RepID=A0AAV0Y0V2_9HEMI|nr:unnamed protein product [Macrosiphum euphorbiae]
MIKIFCRIPYFKGIHNKNLKHFYVRCLRLLLTSVSFEKFTDILKALLTVSMSETDGWYNNEPTPAESARKMLLDKIKGIDINYEDMTDIDSEVEERGVWMEKNMIARNLLMELKNIWKILNNFPLRNQK